MLPWKPCSFLLQLPGWPSLLENNHLCLSPPNTLGSPIFVPWDSESCEVTGLDWSSEHPQRRGREGPPPAALTGWPGVPATVSTPGPLSTLAWVPTALGRCDRVLGLL